MSEHQDILGSTLDSETLNLSDYIVVSGKIVSNPVITGPVIQELAPSQASFENPSYAAPPISSKVKRRGRPVGQIVRMCLGLRGIFVPLQTVGNHF